jgi:hypothetical protein
MFHFDDPDLVWMFLASSLITLCLVLLCCGSIWSIVMVVKSGVIPMLCCIQRCSSDSPWTDLNELDLDQYPVNEKGSRDVLTDFRNV